MKRVEAVRDFRLASKKEATRRSAETPSRARGDLFLSDLHAPRVLAQE